MQKVAFVFSVIFLSCNHAEEKKFFPQTALHTNSNATILHGIVVHQKGGLEISQAFLSHADGTFINNRNNVRLGEVVYLNLVVKGGWMAEGDSVAVGAAQNIVAENGQPVLSSPDLFANAGKIYKAKAAHLLLKTTLTKASSGAQKFLVNYRVWDKMGPGEASGSYWLLLEGNAK